MQLALRVADGAAEELRDLVVLVAVHVVQHKDHAIALGQGVNRTLQSDAVRSATKLQIVAAHKTFRTLALVSLDRVIQRIFEWTNFFAAKEHQCGVDGDPVQPGGQHGVSAKAGDLAECLQKRVLRQIFGDGDVAHHAVANIENSRCISVVHVGKCFRIVLQDSFYQLSIL